jgi:hypothetical protein
VIVSPDQLTFDETLERLVEQLDERRHIELGACRLLEVLVRRGLAERDLFRAAQLVAALDEPQDRDDGN